MNDLSIMMAQQDGRTPIFDAAAHGELDVVQYLLENNADVNAQETVRTERTI
jgi:hypothetical protein